jgi:HSP20 family protein
MSTLMRRDPLHLDFPDWMSRWLDDRGLADRFLGDLPNQVRVEELTEDGTHVIRAELPGIDPDKDVEITVHDGMVHITGERTEKKEERDKASYRSEFRYGRFERTLPLPAGATSKDVSATYKDGVLEVRLPVQSEAVEAAKIPIQRAT